MKGGTALPGPFTRIACLTALTFGLCAGPATAVTDEEIFRDFRFNFINPGARSLGMGGSFIAIANDSTAARSNPAGLTNLFGSEFFTEVRNSDIDSTRTINAPTGSGFDTDIVTRFENRTTPSFLSYAYWNGGSLYFAVSRQEVLNVRNTADSDFTIDTGNAIDVRSARGEIDLLLVQWNASLAWDVKEDTFALGATVSLGQMDLRSRLVNSYELIASDAANPLVGVPLELFSTEADGTDEDITFAVGFLWKPTEHWAVGGVGRQGGDFAIDQTLNAQFMPTGAADPTRVPGTITNRLFFNETQLELTNAEDGGRHPFQNEFHVPDTVGVGLAWEPSEALTLSVDGVRIYWSDLLEGFNSRLNVLTLGWETEEEASFTVDDQTNVHVGAEYHWDRGAGRPDWFFRAGYHTQKDNRIRADFPNGEFGFGLGSNANFAAGDDEDHYSLGIGTNLNDRLQLDFAVDSSQNSFELVGSLIYFFGKEGAR